MSSSVPCYQAYALASSAVACTSVAVVLALTAFGFYSYTLHKDPNKKFSNTTKYDVESSSWVLVLSALGALSGGLSVIVNYECGPTCPAATLACNTLSGQYGAALVAAISAMSAAALKIASFFHQTYIAKSLGGSTVNDDDQLRNPHVKTNQP